MSENIFVNDNNLGPYIDFKYEFVKTDQEFIDSCNRGAIYRDTTFGYLYIVDYDENNQNHKLLKRIPTGANVTSYQPGSYNKYKNQYYIDGSGARQLTYNLWKPMTCSKTSLFLGNITYSNLDTFGFYNPITNSFVMFATTMGYNEVEVGTTSKVQWDTRLFSINRNVTVNGETRRIKDGAFGICDFGVYENTSSYPEYHFSGMAWLENDYNYVSCLGNSRYVSYTFPQGSLKLTHCFLMLQGELE